MSDSCPRGGIHSRWLLGLTLVASAAAAGDLKELQAVGSLRVLAIIDEREPEFLALKGGAPTGFDLEVLQAFAKSQRLELKVVPIGAWEALVPALLEQKGDLIAGPEPAAPRVAVVRALLAKSTATEDQIDPVAGDGARHHEGA